MSESSETNNLNLSELDRLWLFLRQNDRMYLLNKIASVLICFGFAAYTLMFKGTFYAYRNTYPDATNIGNYALVYWLLFIYFSFHGIDELLELYAVYFKREKGALGLLFEMNYFLGLGVCIYILWFVRQDNFQITDPAFLTLSTYVLRQNILFYIAIGVSVLMTVCFHKLNTEVTKTKTIITKDDFQKAN